MFVERETCINMAKLFSFSPCGLYSGKQEDAGRSFEHRPRVRLNEYEFSVHENSPEAVYSMAYVSPQPYECTYQRAERLRGPAGTFVKKTKFVLKPGLCT